MKRWRRRSSTPGQAASPACVAIVSVVATGSPFEVRVTLASAVTWDTNDSSDLSINGSGCLWTGQEDPTHMLAQVADFNDPTGLPWVEGGGEVAFDVAICAGSGTVAP